MKFKQKNKIYIIDGPDCTGKTTLCEELKDKLNIPYYHLTYYKDKDKHLDQFKMIYNKIINKKEDEEGFIVDRYILSELVYADVYRNSEYFEDQWIVNILSNYINSKDIIRVISLPSNKDKYVEFFNSKLDGRDEMYTEKQSAVYDRYKHYIDELDMCEFVFHDILKED